MTGRIDPRLGDYAPINEFAEMISRTRRTVSKMIKEVDGLPHVRHGMETYIPIPEAKEWLARRVRRHNPTRRGA